MASPQTPPSHAVHRPGRVGFGAGRVVFWNGGGIWIGHAGGRADAHAHHAIQLSFALGGMFRIRVDNGDWEHHAGAIVMPHVRHEFDGAGQRVAIVFIEPESRPGRALLAHHGEASLAAVAASHAVPLRKALDEHADDAALGRAACDVIDHLAEPLPPIGHVDPRISRAIDWMRGRLAAPLALADAAAVAHLSPGRFRHLFVAQTGTTFRAYLLWARLRSAVAAAMAGCSWTDAALEAGFADSAHLSRTCRRMIGLAPGMLARER